MERAIFNCTAQGGPNTTIIWIRETNPFTNDMTIPLDELVVVSNDSALVLESINGADGGLYTCIAINEAGSDNSTVTLYVRPEITTQPMDQFVDPGDNITLTCIADSFPAPTYQWQRMNMTTGEFENLQDETNALYTIYNIHDKFGTYRCVVTTAIINEVIMSNSSTVSGKYIIIFNVNFIF